MNDKILNETFDKSFNWNVNCFIAIQIHLGSNFNVSSCISISLLFLSGKSMSWWITSVAHLTFLFGEGWRNHSQCCHFHLQHTPTHIKVWSGHFHNIAPIYKSPEPLVTLRHFTHAGLASSTRVCVCLQVQTFLFHKIISEVTSPKLPGIKLI